MGKGENNSSISLYYKPKSLTGVFMDLKKISRDINSQLNNYEIGKIQ